MNAANSAEIILAFVGGVGVDLTIAEAAAETQLKKFGFSVETVKITRDVLPRLDSKATRAFDSDFKRINTMMDVGNSVRKKFGNDILASGVASEIAKIRKSKPAARRAVLIHSLKHPEEVRKLREIYPRSFYLIGIHAPLDARNTHLKVTRKTSSAEADDLIDRDQKEELKHGQHVIDTFHLADFFAGWAGDDVPTAYQESFDDLLGAGDFKDAAPNSKRLSSSINRFIEVILGHPFKTPTFGEYAMFMAYSASLRSADLSRQVGAVIASEQEILSTGANDCPSYGGGLYWPDINPRSGEITDSENGRDYMRGFDSNRQQQDEIIERIIGSAKEKIKDESAIKKLQDILDRSDLRSLTEYGRVVHAEMAALLSCARRGVSTSDAAIYCTTFPCHNCAKHIIAAGIKKVVFVEPYLKSKAVEFHDEAIIVTHPQDNSFSKSAPEGAGSRVRFVPFFGVGPRRFFDLFSMKLGSGREIVRKNRNGKNVTWDGKTAVPRINQQVESYFERENAAKQAFEANCT
ncbi:anti-phage dCTP deaminase [Haloferula rosea]|uniref:CMP/dCMP-type deaminase domain-containing protein n=1 Tax=Haloferula rosea TaxID=490093 RepID=A0A934RC47_9BACT|nr:anti-phage dCTP deaminase [Haloferula rosea]MBK1826887.1 hypothetical protein [Haloferula rosea]